MTAVIQEEEAGGEVMTVLMTVWQAGIIREREADVLAAAKEAGYIITDRLAKGEWVALGLKVGA